MADDRSYPRGKATALIAYILDLSAGDGPRQQDIDGLADAICADGAERARLISAVGASQDPEIRLQVLEILGRRLRRLKNALEKETDDDEVVGSWSQRVAVTAALRETWSNGQTEGQINRLKTLKRQMYGRAGMDLLRVRLVASP